MTKYKYDNGIASLKYDLQQVVYQFDRAIWGREGFDQDFHFSEAVKMLDDVLAKVAVYQQDQWYKQAEEVESLAEQAMRYATSKELEG